MKILQDMSGFTLIEILIATVIITIASSGIAILTVGVIQGNAFSKRLTTATVLAQDRIEQAKMISYQDVGTMAGTENYGSIANYSGYKRITSVSNDTPTSNMKTVTVVVYGNAEKHLVNLSTILAE
jgi:prepilin-type N-terminal cleavage/methylation domain-containing protein